MLALIDGDIVCYRAGFAAERTRYKAWADNELVWDDYDYRAMMAHLKANGIEEFEVEREREYEPLEFALNNAKTMMETILSPPTVTPEGEPAGGVGCDQYFLALSTGEKTFRHKEATILPYKGNRKDAAKPKYYEEIRKYLTNQWNAVTFESVEADDVVALGQQYGMMPSVICSIDKDLLQVSGTHYHIVSKEIINVTPEEAKLNLWCQVLTGDATDNIPGIKGVGPVKARKLLESTPPSQWHVACMDAWDGCIPLDLGLSPEEVVEEVKMLVTVGGERAIEALNESGEVKKMRSIPFHAGTVDS